MTIDAENAEYGTRCFNSWSRPFPTHSLTREVICFIWANVRPLSLLCDWVRSWIELLYFHVWWTYLRNL